MINVNFVPDEYIQNNDSRRTNFMYIALLIIVIGSLAAVYATLSIQYKSSLAKEQALNLQLSQKKQQIKQVEELQEKRNAMLKTALTTANLIEPVGESVIVAALINNLPENVSFLNLGINQKQVEIKPVAPASAANTYQKEIAKKQTVQQPALPETKIITELTIEGLAPSDLGLAHYIENLTGSSFFENVALVESKERIILNSTFRQFKLTAKLCDNIKIDDEKLDNIRIKSEEIEKIAKKIN